MVYSFKIENRYLRWLVRALLGIVIFAVLLLLFIRSPWGQNLIVSRLVSYVSGKTGTEVAIEKLYIDFSGNVVLQDLYLEDLQGDTLVYSHKLEARLALTPLLFRNELDLATLKWDGLRAHIARPDSSGYNFEFLIRAFPPPDTTTRQSGADAFQLRLGAVDLSDFNIQYYDKVVGIQADIRLGELRLQSRKTDLKTLEFELGDIHLSQTQLSLVQTGNSADTSTPASPLPRIHLGKMTLNEVSLAYGSVPDSLRATAYIQDLSLDTPEFDLPENRLHMQALRLRNSSFKLIEEGTARARGDSLPDQPFAWPEFDLRAGTIALENNNFLYQAPPDKISGGQARDLWVSGISGNISDLVYQAEKAALDLNSLRFREAGGFSLNEFSARARISDSEAVVSNFRLRTPLSSLQADMHLDYESLQHFLKTPENSRISLSVPGARIALEEVLYFRPELAENTYFMKAADKPVELALEAAGTIDSLSINTARISWGNQTSLSARAAVRHLTSPERLWFSTESLRFETQKQDVLNFVSEADLGITLPPSLRLQGNATGKPNRVDGRAELISSFGNLQLAGSFARDTMIRMQGTLQTEGLRLDSLLRNNRLGAAGMNAEFKGAGSDLRTLDINLAVRFTRLEAMDYDFSGLVLDGELEDGEGKVGLTFQDENLDLAAQTSVRLGSGIPEAELSLQVEGANLLALGLTREDIRLALNMEADYSGTVDDYNLNARIHDGIAVYDGRQFHSGDLNFIADMDSVRTDIRVSGAFLEGELQSNTSMPAMQSALKDRFKKYFQSSPDTQATSDSVQAALRLKINPTPIITEVFLRDIKSLDSILVDATYDGAAGRLRADVSLPSAVYGGITIDSLHVRVNGTPTDLAFSAGFRNLVADPLHIRHTTLTGDLRDKELQLDLSSLYEGKPILHIASGLTLSQDTLYLRVSPEALVLNSNPWAIPANNRITMAEDLLRFENVSLTRNGQQLAVGNAFPGIEKDHIGVGLENFRLQTFLSLLNPEEPLISGAVNGELIVENPFLAPGMLADFRIAGLEVMDNPMGNLNFHGTSDGSAGYGFDLALAGGGADLTLIGEYQASTTAAEMDLALEIQRLDMQAVQAFSSGAIEESRGYITGHINVQGTTADPEYEGTLNFEETGFRVATLNAPFSIADEHLRLDTDGVYFEDFNISDTQGSNLSLDGSIITKELLNPGFDLGIQAEDFRALNSTEEDNDLFYGKANVDIDLTLAGNLELPRVEGRVRVGEQTEITYVVPETQLEVEEREGVVVFVNRENPDDILTRATEEEAKAIFTGLDVQTVLEIAREATFNVIIDQRSGDNLSVSGEGALNLSISPNGRTQLSGRYELQSGHYETTLYNLVNRRFEIQPGSTISWQGDPMDAKLDVTAVYQVETSAAPLMASVISGQGAIVAGQYRQVLPFLVYLNVDGEIMQPEISFDLDMPEDEQGALGGAVYSRVQQLNQQEAELNKEVFSLLALNRFYPASGSDGSAGGTAAIARDNVNKVLSGELNAFSDRVFGKSGFELDFDLDSFTDYQGESPQERTQLNINARKKLFDDRLIVTAGSAVDVEGSAQPGQEETPIIGNVSLEYLLTENGRYRLRGFRKSEYQNIIDGQLIVTGLALIFNREFNEFSELFNPLKAEEEEENQENKIGDGNH